MDYRFAARDDLEQFVGNRTEFVSSIRKIEDLAEFESCTREYLKSHIGGDDLIICLACEDHNIAASCMACIYTVIPLPGCPSGKAAEVLNAYTRAEHRRKGHAKKLLTMLLEALRARGVQVVRLEYTKEGYSLYKRMGFEEMEHQMMLRLLE